jgi:fused signal recognition particle receptor
VGVTGILLTKLAGTAKGDGVFGICNQLRTPIRFVGAGAEANDLALFESKQLVGGLFA